MISRRFDRRNLPLLISSQEHARRNGWYRIRNLEPGEAEVFIYDIIGASWFDEGVEAGRFVRELRAIEADRIHLRVNSPGGDVFDALAIAEALDEHSAEIWTHIDGVGASAASWVGIRAAKTIMAPKARLFIHDPWSVAIGYAEDFRKEADLLDGLGDDIADLYAAKAGGSRQEWRDRMRAETWYSDQQAVDAGLADEIAGKASTENAFDPSILNIFGNVPDELLKRHSDGGGKPSIRSAEDALRDAGLSRSQARAVLSRGWDALEAAPHGAEDALRELLSTIRAAS